MINAAMPRDAILMAMPRAELSQMVRAAKAVCARAKPKRVFIYFGLDTFKKCGLRGTMHEAISFENMMKVLKRVLPAIQQLILGLSANTLPSTHPVFPAGLACANQSVRRLFSILYTIMFENRVSPILTATSIPVPSVLENPSGLNYATAWEYVIQVHYAADAYCYQPPMQATVSDFIGHDLYVSWLLYRNVG